MTSIETLLFRRGIRSLKPRLLIYNEVREDREDGATRRALEPPDSEPAQADTDIMGVACEAATTATRRLMSELKAQRQDEGQHAFNKRFAVAQQLIVRAFVVKIDSDGAVFAGLAASVAHRSSSDQMVGAGDDAQWGNAYPIARRHAGVGALPLKAMECGRRGSVANHRKQKS